MGDGILSLAERYHVDLDANPVQRRLLGDLVSGKVPVPSFMADVSSYGAFVKDILGKPENGNIRVYIDRVTDDIAKAMMSPVQFKRMKARGMAVYAKGPLSLLFDMCRESTVDNMNGRLYLMGADDAAKKGKKDEEPAVSNLVVGKYKHGDGVLFDREGRSPKGWSGTKKETSFGFGEFWTHLETVYGMKGVLKGYVSREMAMGEATATVSELDFSVMCRCGGPGVRDSDRTSDKWPALGNTPHLSGCDKDESRNVYNIFFPVKDKGTWETMRHDAKVYNPTGKDAESESAVGAIMKEFTPPGGTEALYGVIQSIPSDFLKLDIPEEFAYKVGDLVRVRSARGSGPKARAVVADYRGRFGKVVARETRETGSDEERKEWENLGRKQLSYDIRIDGECDACSSVLSRRDGKMECVNPPCGRSGLVLDEVYKFWEHEVEVLTREQVMDEKAGSRMSRPLGVYAMPEIEVTADRRSVLDGLIAHPPVVSGAGDVELSDADETGVYLYRRVGKKGDFVLAGHVTRRFSGKGSVLLDGLRAEHNGSPFVSMRTAARPVDWGFVTVECVGLVVTGSGDYYQYRFAPDGAVALSREEQHPLYVPKWKSAAGVLVEFSTKFDGKDITMFPFRAPDAEDVPFLVSDKPYTFHDRLRRKFVVTTKSIKYSAWLYAGAEGELERDRGQVELGGDKRFFACVTFDASIGDAPAKEYSLLLNHYNAVAFTIFDRTCYYYDTAYIPVEKVLLEGMSSLCRRVPPPGQKMFYNISVSDMGMDRPGEASVIRSEVVETVDRGLSDTGMDGLDMQADLPADDAGFVDSYSGRCYIMAEGHDCPPENVLMFSRVTTNEGIYAVLNEAGEDVPPFGEPPVKEVGAWDRIEVGARDWGKKAWDLDAFHVRRGDMSTVLSKRSDPPDFDWAVVGDVSVAGALAGHVFERGAMLDGTFARGDKLYAKDVVVVGDAGEKFDFRVVRNPGEGQVDEIIVTFGDEGDVVRAEFGRGGERLPYVAEVGKEFAFGPAPARFAKVDAIDYRELMTFREREAMRVRTAEQARANYIFERLKGVNQEHDDSLTLLTEPFDAVVLFDDGTRFRYTKGAYSVHFPVRAVNGYTDRDVEGVTDVSVLCVECGSYLKPPAGNAWYHRFEKGEKWEPLGKVVKGIKVSVAGPVPDGMHEGVEYEPEPGEPVAVVEEPQKKGRKKTSA